eukprot:TRINITY_DN46272_c0_g4_i1.p2 TRINITY_DN46272_c0_g4~~TRINITY_DN46272_c0_g4_i1.p2  ORF type:complete len:102 (+),score=8.51 TRINITY_DN46272_c0_g4_i1:113-418(+)
METGDLWNLEKNPFPRQTAKNVMLSPIACLPFVTTKGAKAAPRARNTPQHGTVDSCAPRACSSPCFRKKGKSPMAATGRLPIMRGGALQKALLAKGVVLGF